MIKLVEKRKPDTVMMRDVYIDQLIEFAKSKYNRTRCGFDAFQWYLQIFRKIP